MEELSRAEREQAGEMSSFRRRVAEQREASARELSLVMQRVQQSATTSKRASATGASSRPPLALDSCICSHASTRVEFPQTLILYNHPPQARRTVREPYAVQPAT